MNETWGNNKAKNMLTSGREPREPRYSKPQKSCGSKSSEKFSETHLIPSHISNKKRYLPHLFRRIDTFRDIFFVV